jgi:Na+-driven multidrug efflux pump
VTNVISQSLGLGIGLWILFTGRTRLKLTLSNFRIDFGTIWRIVKIALPSSVSSMERPFAQLVLMWIIVPFGTLAVAAHTIVQRVEVMLLMPGMAMGMSSGVLAAQNLGAGQPERAERSVWLAVAIVQAFTTVCALSILVWAAGIVEIFSSNPGVIEIGSKFMRISVVGFLVLGIVVVFMQSISGTGDTLPPMLITTLGMWGVEVPLAFLLPNVGNLGVYGVRWATVTGMLVRTVVYIAYFKTGRWKRKKV